MHFEPDEIRQFLNNTFNYIHDVEPVANGWWSQALTFYAKDEKLVLRINRHPLDFQKDVFAFEHFNSNLIPVPAIKSIGNFNEEYFYCVSEFIEGKPSQLVLDTADLTGLEPVASKLLQPLLHIHELDVQHLPGWGYTGANGHGIFNSWEAFLLAIHNSKTPVTWQEMAGSSWLDGALFERLLEKMKSFFQFLPTKKSVLHGDYGFSNLIVGPDNDVVAVIDWAEMMLGDPLYDLIHMCEPWEQQLPVTVFDLWKAAMQKAGIPLTHLEERLLCYNIHFSLFSMHIMTSKKDEKAYRRIEQWAKENLL